jgi:hypothetical protein
VDTQAIPRVTAANVVDFGSGADTCPDNSGDGMYADAMEKLAALHEDWLEALARLRGVPTETGPEFAAA